MIDETRPGSEGFSVIEAIVAFALVAMALVSMFDAIAVGVKALDRSRRISTEDLSRSKQPHLRLSNGKWEVEQDNLGRARSVTFRFRETLRAP